MAIQGLFYIDLQVSDLARSKAFYGRTLGWPLETDEPHVAGFRFGSAYLVIVPDQRPAGRRVYAGGAALAVRVDDLDAQHAALAQAGAAPGAIISQPWGERSFTFADPDGYLWRYASPA